MVFERTNHCQIAGAISSLLRDDLCRSETQRTLRILALSDANSAIA